MRQVVTWFGFAFLLLVLSGCRLPFSPLNVTVTATPTPAWEDASAVMAGICFEAAFDAAGQVFILRSEQALIDFYDLADFSELCRQLVPRVEFDFSGGAVLVGLWSSGLGCTAQHDTLATERDPTRQTISIQLRFSTTGDCPYELVRPFWIALPDAAGYEISLTVE